MQWLLWLIVLVVVACGEAVMSPPADPVHTYTINVASLSWDANAPLDNVLEYRIYRSTVPGDYPIGTPYAVVDGATTTFRDTTGTADVEYFFVITAFNGLESDVSNEVSKRY